MGHLSQLPDKGDNSSSGLSSWPCHLLCHLCRLHPPQEIPGQPLVHADESSDNSVLLTGKTNQQEMLKTLFCALHIFVADLCSIAT